MATLMKFVKIGLPVIITLIVVKQAKLGALGVQAQTIANSWL